MSQFEKIVKRYLERAVSTLVCLIVSIKTSNVETVMSFAKPFYAVVMMTGWTARPRYEPNRTAVHARHNRGMFVS